MAQLPLATRGDSFDQQTERCRNDRPWEHATDSQSVCQGPRGDGFARTHYDSGMNNQATGQAKRVMARPAAAVLALLSALVIGWIAFVVQQQNTLPAFLFPLIYPLFVGAFVGGACFAICHWLARPSLRLVCLVACLSGCVAVLSQSWASYRAYAASINDAVSHNPKAALASVMTDEFKPASPARFVKSQIQRSHGWWIVDAVLILLASIVTAVLACNLQSAKSPTK